MSEIIKQLNIILSKSKSDSGVKYTAMIKVHNSMFSESAPDAKSAVSQLVNKCINEADKLKDVDGSLLNSLGNDYKKTTRELYDYFKY